MKKVKLIITILALGLFTAAVACNKDDKNDKGGSTNNYPKTLTYKGYEVKEFKMYVGSSEGGKEVSTIGIDPQIYWKDDLNQSIEKVKSRSYQILSDTKLYYSDGANNGEVFYKFENGRFFLKASENDEWFELNEYGNENQINVKQTFEKWRTYSHPESNTYTTMKTMLQLMQLQSLQEMTNPSDTIIWCNLDFVWR